MWNSMSMAVVRPMLRVGAAIVGLVGAVTVSCGMRGDEPGENVGKTSEGLTVEGNYSVTGSSYYGLHETSVSIPHAGEDGNKGWVVGFNGPSRYAGWAYSGNLGTSWTANVQTSATAWGNPGNSPYDAGPLSDGGGAFAGWLADPSVAPVTDPTLSENGQRMMYTMVDCAGVCGRPGNLYINDVLIALSRDSGKTWGYTSYVSGDIDAGGGNVDNPWVATEQFSPYHTFVVWTSSATSSDVGWLAQVEYPADAGPVSVVNRVPLRGSRVLHPRIATGWYRDCLENVKEAVFIAYADNAPGACPEDGSENIINPIHWYL